MQVFYYDGNVPCFSGEHLAFAIPALLLLLLVVLLGPAIVILISFKRYKVRKVCAMKEAKHTCIIVLTPLLLPAENTGIY